MVPVLGGMIVLALIFVATWLIAVLVSGGDTSERLAPSEFRVGAVEQVAEEVNESGPIVFPDLNTTSGTRTLVLDHEGTDPTRGWVVYWGFRAGGDPLCDVTQVEGTTLVHRLHGCSDRRHRARAAGWCAPARRRSHHPHDRLAR